MISRENTLPWAPETSRAIKKVEGTRGAKYFPKIIQHYDCLSLLSSNKKFYLIHYQKHCPKTFDLTCALTVFNSFRVAIIARNPKQNDIMIWYE